MSNLIIYSDKFVTGLNLNDKFELKKEEKEMIKGQGEFHASHVTPIFISKEEHEKMHGKTR